MKLILKYLICLAALVITAYVFPSYVSVIGGIAALAAGAAVLWLLNLLVRPLAQIICLPVTLLTFGLFFFIVNAGMVALMDFIMPVIHFHGLWIYLIVALIISLGNFAIKSEHHERAK